MRTTRSRAISGVKWTTASTITLTLVNLVKLSVLARFLDKTDFGLMALVTFVLGFMSLFMDMGLTSAILHKQDISKKEYASLYWLNVLFSIAIVLLIYLLSPFISSFYREPELTNLIRLMSLSVIFSALGRQFKTIEQKNLNFKYIAVADMTGSVVALITGILLAIKGYGVYSLVIGGLAQYLVSNILFLFKGIMVEGVLFHFNYQETQKFIKIGMYQVGGQFINYFNRDLDILIIGKFLGAEVLGGYSLAKQLVRRPLQIVTPIINRICMGIFPKHQNNKPKLRAYFLTLFKGMGAFNAFVFGFIAVFANYLIILLYGPDYISIVPLVQLFVIVTFLRSMGNLVGILVITTGRTDSEFYWNIFVTFLMPVTVIAGAVISVNMVIVFISVLQLALLIPAWYIFYKKQLGLSLMPYMKSHLLPAILVSVFVVLSQLFFRGEVFWQVTLFIGMFFTISLYSYYSIREIKIYIQGLKNKYSPI